MDPIATAQYGMLAASRRFEGSAERVARQGVEVDLGAEIVDQLVAKTEFSANLAVIRTAREMSGELLDILA